MSDDFPSWYGIANYRSYGRRRSIRHCVFCAMLVISICCSLVAIGMILAILMMQ